MKVIVLAGGLPSIIGEENDKIPKPMVQVGERPVLWHIMKLFSHYGLNDFIICTGYKANVIKDYFLNYYVYRSDITVHLKNNKVDIHNHVTEPWNVTMVDTGLRTTTAERLYIVSKMIDEDAIVVYGDCVSDLNVPKLIGSHKESGKVVSLTLAKPTGRNRIIPLDSNGRILKYGEEETELVDAWANACIMVVSHKMLKEKPKASERFEVETVKSYAEKGQVNTYRHHGFWMPIETVRDRDYMQRLWDNGKIPWKKWD